MRNCTKPIIGWHFDLVAWRLLPPISPACGAGQAGDRRVLWSGAPAGGGRPSRAEPSREFRPAATAAAAAAPLPPARVWWYPTLPRACAGPDPPGRREVAFSVRRFILTLSRLGGITWTWIGEDSVSRNSGVLLVICVRVCG